jgi:hypothetical protein
MTIVLRESTPVAKNDYICSACEWVINCDVFDDCTFSEKKAIVLAKRNNWKIKKGEVYMYQVNIWCGDFNVFKGIPAMHNICLKYDLYEE